MCVCVHIWILPAAKELVLINTQVVRLRKGNGQGNQKPVRTALTVAAL